MKMIDVLIKLANDEIKDQTILKIYDHTGDLHRYTFDGKFKAFYDESDDELGGDFEISNKFLNYEAELIPPKHKKYMVKFNMRGLKENYRYLNYIESDECAHINDKRRTTIDKTQFTKQELKSIQPVRDFLEDMQGKFELVEVKENEID